MSNSVRPHRRQPTRLPRPWDSPGKNTGVRCHFLLQCMKVKSESEVAQSCPTPSDPMDCSPPGSSVHGVFQARVLEWGAIAMVFLNSVTEKQQENSHIHTSLGNYRLYQAARRWTIAQGSNSSIYQNRAELTSIANRKHLLGVWEENPRAVKQTDLAPQASCCFTQ